jgi:photosystem II stability/assembly factor-like uncharacterized protein
MTMKQIKYFAFIVFIFIQGIFPLKAQWNHLSGLAGQQLLSMVEKDTCIFIGTDFQGIYRTTDFGTNWVQVNSGLTQHAIKTICVKGTDLFVGTYSGIFRSTNNGDVWSSSGLINTNVEDIVTDGNYIFAGTDLGVYRSSDNGMTWLLKSTGITNTAIHALFIQGSRLFTGTWYNNEGIFVSSDFGETWNLSNSGLSAFEVSTFATIGNDIFAGTNTSGVFRSTDNGVNWTKCDSGLTHGIIGKLTTIGENIFAATYGGGIFLSTNRGVSWSLVSTGIPSLFIGPMSCIGSYLYAGTFGDGVFRRQLGTMPIAYKDTAVLSHAPGWNLVSTPFVPYLSLPDSVFKNNQSVFGFKNSTKTYSSPTEIVFGNAYWTYNFQADSNSIYGSSKDSVILFVPQSGWVLLGSQFLNIPVSHLTSVPSGSILGDIYRFNTNLGSYEPAIQIIPGEGYWVYVTQPCKLKLQ